MKLFDEIEKLLILEESVSDEVSLSELVVDVTSDSAEEEVLPVEAVDISPSSSLFGSIPE